MPDYDESTQQLIAGTSTELFVNTAVTFTRNSYLSGLTLIDSWTMPAWLADLVEHWISTATSGVRYPMLAIGVAVITKLDRLGFLVCDTYPGFPHHFSLHISTKDGLCRLCDSASCILCMSPCQCVIYAFWEANKLKLENWKFESYKKSKTLTKATNTQC